MSQEVPSPGEKKEVGAEILYRHPECGSPKDDPGSNPSADQLVKEPEYEKVEAENRNDKE